jgi:CheY-like chemotaxis protein
MPKILLVEDNEINRDMLRRRLERKGYQVIVAINGAEGVTKTQADQPDLVLMDLHLPVLDGWEATRQIKANPKTQTIPVIALTADALAGEREKALAAGCDDYDTKPVDFTRLLEKIDTLLKSSEVQPSQPLNFSLDHRQQSIEWNRLRHKLEPSIYRIIGYSDLLLDTLSNSENSALSNDLQKIYISGLQLLKLVQAILNPSLLEVQQQDWTIDLLAPALRRELLTPLSTILGYCELLLEESPADVIPDLKQIYTSAQDLLDQVNRLDRLVELQSDSDEELETLAWQRPPTLKADLSLAQNRHILVIDNDANSSTVRQLERQGYEVQIATTEQQVSQVLSASSCDLIVLDISQTGLKILRQIKSHETGQQIPVLLLAAADGTIRALQGIEMGAIDYLTKPVPAALLQMKVAACIEYTQLREQVIHYKGIVEEFKDQKRLETDLSQQIEALQLELEQIKRSQQVSEIVQTDYFQQLQSNVEPSEAETVPPVSLPLKVLLVEDNELNCDMLCRRLQRHGYEVVIATDGAEGISKALSEQPQIILMDISLPVMDGWEATQQLKANPQTCRIPIIALTAHAMAGDREKALACGCDDYDTKPIELPRLLSKIEDCLKSSLTN